MLDPEMLELGADEREGRHGIEGRRTGSSSGLREDVAERFVRSVRPHGSGLHPGRVETDAARAAAMAHRASRQIGHDRRDAPGWIAGHDDRRRTRPAEQRGRAGMHIDRLGHMLRLEQQQRVETVALHQRPRPVPIDRHFVHSLRGGVTGRTPLVRIGTE